MNIYKVRMELKALQVKKKYRENETLADCLEHLEHIIDFHEKMNLDVLQKNKSLAFDENDIKDCKEHIDKFVRGIDVLKKAEKPLVNINFFDKLVWKLEGQKRRLLKGVQSSLRTTEYTLDNFKEHYTIHLKMNRDVYHTYKDNIKFLMAQGNIPGLGGSRGECYGITFAYADYLDHNKEGDFKFSESVSYTQNTQLEKNPENLSHYKKHLGIKHYEPELKKQAEGLIKYAKKYQGKHLFLSLTRSMGNHACYLQFSADAKTWHYMDPNYGAFEFSSPDEFKAFYQDVYKKSPYPWHSYSVSELRKSPPKNTFAGKLRSILTGAHYKKGLKAEYLMGMALAAGIITGITLAVFFAPITFTATIFGLSLITLAPVIKLAIAGSIGFYSSIILSAIQKTMAQNNFRGLLGFPRAVSFLVSLLVNSLVSFFKKSQPELDSPNEVADNTLEPEQESHDKITDAHLEPELSSYLSMLNVFDKPKPLDNEEIRDAAEERQTVLIDDSSENFALPNANEEDEVCLVFKR